MGQADSTTNVGISGLCIFNAYHNNKFKPFLEDMTEEYVEEDNIKFLFTEYRNWLSTTDIHKYFDEYLNSNRAIFLNSSTPKNYISKIIITLK